MAYCPVGIGLRGLLPWGMAYVAYCPVRIGLRGLLHWGMAYVAWDWKGKPFDSPKTGP